MNSLCGSSPIDLLLDWQESNLLTFTKGQSSIDTNGLICFNLINLIGQPNLINHCYIKAEMSWCWHIKEAANFNPVGISDGTVWPKSERFGETLT